MPQVTFFVPCLNEEQNISGTLTGIVEAASEVGVSHEILVIDDCSTDETVRVVEEYQRDHPDVTITLKTSNRIMGVGRNFIDGAFSASTEYYMMVCGDNSRAKDSVVTILRKLGEADMVIPYFGDDQRSMFRRIASRGYVFLVNIASGNSLRYYNGLTLHKRSNVMRFHPDTDGFGVHAELITRLIDEGATYVEVPITNEERESGTSSAFTIRNFLSVAHSLLEIFLRRLRQIILGS